MICSVASNIAKLPELVRKSCSCSRLNRFPDLGTPDAVKCLGTGAGVGFHF
jgi:hypothetical protein